MNDSEKGFVHLGVSIGMWIAAVGLFINPTGGWSLIYALFSVHFLLVAYYFYNRSADRSEVVNA